MKEKYVVLYSDAAERSWNMYFDTYKEAEDYCLEKRQVGVITTIAKVIVEYRENQDPKYYR